MELSGKVLREVEFRDRLRGYDTDEVDEFLEKVAVGVDALLARLEELETKLAAQPLPAPQPPPAPTLAIEDDTIQRTLVLAQRTADLAIGEARDEATRLVEEARAEAEGLLAQAEEGARRLRSEAEQELHARVARLGEERERLEGEVRGLVRLVEEERARLTDSLTAALRVVAETLSVGDEVSGRAARATQEPVGLADRPAPAETADEGTDGAVDGRLPLISPSEPVAGSGPAVAEPLVPDVEQEIVEDAATAAWAPSAAAPDGDQVNSAPSSETGHEAEEALWERWAAGRDLGVVPGPADFGRRAGLRGDQDRGWSA